MRRLLAISVSLAISATSAFAEFELSFYGGSQGAPHSVVTIEGDSVLSDDQFTAGWEGRSFEAPPYYGIRATWWRSESFGWGIDLNHAKVYADDDTLTAAGLDHLEFSDGLNILTVNAYKRWQNRWGQLTPYVGAGLGVSLPHVELIDADNGGTNTFEYQYTGPAIALLAGTRYEVNDRWSVFGEYKFTYSLNEASLTTGGTLSSDIVTNALNIGVSDGF